MAAAPSSAPKTLRLPSFTRHAHPFLPTTREEMEARGWDQLDVILVSGDAYVDHPAFGPPLIGRFLEKQGFRVGMIAQPDWQTADAFRRLGRPRLCFGVAAGNLDSMLNRLTAQKKARSEDQYSPGGRTGCRPDRATLVYAQRCRQAFPDVPLILGGIEASLRRIAHYDYWSETVRRPIVLDAKADLLVFGMGEAPIWEICRRLRDGEPVASLRDVRGTCFPLSRTETQALASGALPGTAEALELPGYESVAGTEPESLAAYARMARLFHKETNPLNARPLWQRVGERAVYFNPPAHSLDEGQMDAIYDLPFNRVAHPSYREPIPALEQVRHSIVTMRGCFGGCTFCSITEHEGRAIQSRSVDSILREVRALRRLDDFRGVISDLGGPTANMYQMRCSDPEVEKSCRRLSCIHPTICKKLGTDHGPVIDLMRRVREEEGVRKVFVASGVRYDLAALSPEYIDALATHHTGGQLSVAPEHVSERVLDLMKKPGKESYEAFASEFACASERAGKEQYLVPYYISGHPGSSLEDMIALAVYLRSRGLRPRQVQDFIPTPMSLAATMYHTGLDPLTGKPVYTAKGLREKRLQKALLLYWDPEQAKLVREALLKAGRVDLVGHGPEHLVSPGPMEDGRHLRGAPRPAAAASAPAAVAARGPSPRGGKRRRPASA